MIDINRIAEENTELGLSDEQISVLSASVQEQAKNLMTLEVAKNHPEINELIKKAKGDKKGEILGMLENQITRDLKELGLNSEQISSIVGERDALAKFSKAFKAARSANSGNQNGGSKELEEKIREIQATSAKAIEEVNKEWESKWTAKENEITTAKINNSITSEVSTFNLLGDMDAQTLRPVINAKLAQLGYALVMGQSGVEVRSAANPEQLAIKDNKLVVFKELIAEITNPFVKKSNSNPIAGIVATVSAGDSGEIQKKAAKLAQQGW